MPTCHKFEILERGRDGGKGRERKERGQVKGGEGREEREWEGRIDEGKERTGE